MSVVAAAPSCRKTLLSGGEFHFKGYPHYPTLKWPCNLGMEKKKRLMKLVAHRTNPSTYTSRISTEIPLYEIPGASFDDYLEDKSRVFKAIFPDKQSSQQQLNDEECRIHMPPTEFLFINVLPVVDMRLRCKSSGREYPPGVPLDVSKVLELDTIRWELQGLDEVLKSSNFSLGVKGTLYRQRRGNQTRLNTRLRMSVSFDLSPVLALMPENIRREAAESALARLLENMKDKVNGSLVADYDEFKRELQKSVRCGFDLMVNSCRS